MHDDDQLLPTEEPEIVEAIIIIDPTDQLGLNEALESAPPLATGTDEIAPVQDPWHGVEATPTADAVQLEGAADPLSGTAPHLLDLDATEGLPEPADANAPGIWDEAVQTAQELHAEEVEKAEALKNRDDPKLVKEGTKEEIKAEQEYVDFASQIGKMESETAESVIGNIR